MGLGDLATGGRAEDGDWVGLDYHLVVYYTLGRLGCGEGGPERCCPLRLKGYHGLLPNRKFLK